MGRAATDGADYGLDASIFIVNKENRVRSDNGFIFYNNPRSLDGSVKHAGYNLTGEGEQVKVDLEKMPGDINELVFDGDPVRWPTTTA